MIQKIKQMKIDIDLQFHWLRINAIFFIISLAICTTMITTCDSNSNEQIYENPEFGISLNKPENWSLKFNERSGSIIMEAVEDTPDKNSARIEIYGYACAPSLSKNLEEQLNSNAERIRRLYNLDSAELVQDPINISESDGIKIMTAIVSIPTMSLTEGSVVNQLGERRSDLLQVTEIHAIRDSLNNSIDVFVYNGESQKLNEEADNIVNSIRFLC